MTDNEKAASFIGWKPGEFRCDGKQWHICLRPAPIKKPPCRHGQSEPHDSVPAPDMTRPEHYMRALEALPRRYPYISLYYVDGDGWCFEMNSNEADDTGAYPRLVEITGRRACASAGDAAVRGLAALYDAEHAGTFTGTEHSCGEKT